MGDDNEAPEVVGGELVGPGATGDTDGAKRPSPASLANLRPWAPGESGNPRGSSKLARELREYISGDLGEKTKADIDAIRELATHAKNERVRLDARQWLVEQVIGRATQPLSDPDGKALALFNVIVMPAENGDDDA